MDHQRQRTIQRTRRPTHPQSAPVPFAGPARPPPRHAPPHAAHRCSSPHQRARFSGGPQNGSPAQGRLSVVDGRVATEVNMVCRQDRRGFGAGRLLRLSERRARELAKIFTDAGVPESSVNIMNDLACAMERLAGMHSCARPN